MAKTYRISLTSRVAGVDSKEMYVNADNIQVAIKKATEYMAERNFAGLEMNNVDLMRSVILLP